jgi:hypothetical protein
MKTSRLFRPMTVVLLMVILLLAVPFTEASSAAMTASPAPTARSSLADALRRDMTLENCDPAYAPNACVVDQAMVNFNGRRVFGGNTVLAQTFRPTVNKRVCKVNVRIHKLINRPTPAGDLILSVRTMGGVILDNAVRPANLIPMGVSVQSFDLGCNGGVLAAGNLYRIVLRERAGAVGDYAWYGHNGNLYANGIGQRKIGAGPWVNAFGQGWDFYFRELRCP